MVSRGIARRLKVTAAQYFYYNLLNYSYDDERITETQKYDTDRGFFFLFFDINTALKSKIEQIVRLLAATAVKWIRLKLLYSPYAYISSNRLNNTRKTSEKTRNVPLGFAR